jgi:hypothetical protein
MAKPKLPARKETEIVKAILEYLAVLGLPHRRMNTGAFKATYNGKTRFHRFGAPGMPDILVCLPPLGRLLWLEVKRPGEKITELQEHFMKEFRGAGALGYVVSSIEDVEDVISLWVQGGDK